MAASVNKADMMRGRRGSSSVLAGVRVAGCRRSSVERSLVRPGVGRQRDDHGVSLRVIVLGLVELTEFSMVEV